MIWKNPCYELEIDRDRTHAYFQTAPEDLGCDCAGCRNFTAAVKRFPQEVLELFDQFGVDPAKPAECYAICAKGRQAVLYGGFYHICGRILRGKEPWVAVGENVRHLDERYSIELPGNFSVFFTEEIHLPEPGFPAPMIQMEFTGEAAWVLNEENPFL